MNRRSITLALAALMVMALAATSYAGWGGGPGRGGCPGWGGQAQQMTPEQQQKLDVLNIEYQGKFTPLHKEALTKHFELEALMVEPQANESKIKTLASELGELKAKLFELRVAHRADLAELGIQNCGGPGYGMGHGKGRGMGRGMSQSMGQGMGQGTGYGPNAADCPYGQGPRSVGNGS